MLCWMGKICNGKTEIVGGGVLDAPQRADIESAPTTVRPTTYNSRRGGLYIRPSGAHSILAKNFSISRTYSPAFSTVPRWPPET